MTGVYVMTGTMIAHSSASAERVDERIGREPTAMALLRLPHATRRLGPGEYLCIEGDAARAVFVVLTGRITVCRDTLAGRTVVLNMVGGDQLLGEIGVFMHRPRMACLRSAGASTVAVIHEDEVLGAAQREAALAIGVAQVVMDRLRGLADRVLDVAALSLEQRLAAVLLGTAAEAPELVRCSQQLLADQLAVTRESVNRQLQQWARLGIVAVRRGAVVIRDGARLYDIANPM